MFCPKGKTRVRTGSLAPRTQTLLGPHGPPPSFHIIYAGGTKKAGPDLRQGRSSQASRDGGSSRRRLCLARFDPHAVQVDEGTVADSG